MTENNSLTETKNSKIKETKNVNEFENEIEKLGWVFGLDSVSALVEELKIKEDIPVIHVAGTNGKGSVCLMLSGIMKEANLKCGLYTSPAVFYTYESITINGQAIEQDVYNDYMIRIKKACEGVVERGISHPTAFEVKTALAYKYFHDMKCDIIVFETGLGGSLDATNFIRKPICSVITEIGMDHTDILGDTIEDIAKAKAGIIKKGSTIFNAATDDKANSVIEKKAKELGADYLKVCYNLSNDRSYKLKTPVECQKRNAHTSEIVAHFVLERLTNMNSLGIEKTIRRGIEECNFPGRFERISDKPLVYIDGGHNAQAVKEVAQTVLRLEREQNKKWVFIFGILKDKDYKTVLDEMCPLAETFHIITVPNPRALDADIIKKEVLKRNTKAVVHENIEEAVDAALDEALGSDTCVLAFGSFYYLKYVKRAIKNGEI
ncbi:MAG: hypothetical protein K6E13_00340 [Lachnospiraceae bacterium]|nr:hypothetical protein [Lachnospiraceae bacterium]